MVQYIPASYTQHSGYYTILASRIGSKVAISKTRPSYQPRKVRKMQTFSGSTGYRRGPRRDNRTGSQRKGRVAALEQSCWYSTAGCHCERSLLFRRPDGPKKRKPQGRIERPRLRSAPSAAPKPRCHRRLTVRRALGKRTDGTGRAPWQQFAQQEADCMCSVSVRLSASMANAHTTRDGNTGIKGANELWRFVSWGG